MNHQLKIATRNFFKKPVYSLITFFGFTIGISACLLIYLWVYKELSYDKFHLDDSRIYRVLTLSKQGNEIVKSAGCYAPVAATLKKDFPQIECAAFLYFSSESSPLQREEGGEKVEAESVWVNNDFFSIFNGFPFIEGNAFDAIQDPNGIILSERTARKLFGNKSALGKTLISDKYFKSIYTVRGVIRIPKNSHIDFGYMLTEANSTVKQYMNYWGDKPFVHVYIKLQKNAQIDPSFLQLASNQITKYSSRTDKLLFQPLADIHLYSDYTTSRFDQHISSYKYVWIFSGLAILIILMASFNFSVLSVARASERSVEIGVKKVNGAGRSQLIAQFMGESLFQTILASFLALILVGFSLPLFNQLSGTEISVHLSFKLVVNLILLILVVAVLAGIYPSFFMSFLNPKNIFQGGGISGSKTNFIRALVAVQFCIAIFFMIATGIFVKQLNYIRHKDLGLDHQNVVVIPTGLWYSNKAFKEELLQNPDVLSVSAGAAPIDAGWEVTLPLNHQGTIDSLTVSMYCVDEDFVKTYHLEIVKGKFLGMDYSTYWDEFSKANKGRKEGKEYTMSMPVVINESAEKMLGFENPIGQRIGEKVIVGVVKDFNFQTLYHPIGPVILMNDPQNIGTMNVKIASVNKAATLKYTRHVYQKYRDQRAFSYRFLDDLMQQEYSQDTRLRNITILFSLLAVSIAVLGILGMAVFSINRKIKEIGIRKVNGARVSEILTMLNKDFVKWVAIAFVIATPLAYYAMNKWLENFAYKTSLNWWIFAMAGVLALGIALLTVSWKSWKAATRNPVEALRYE